MVCFFAAAAIPVVQVLAQTQNIGCDGAMVLKAGRGGPCTELAMTIAALLSGPAVVRDHWGIAVTAMDGAPIYLLNEGQLFQPASNAKLYTTATAMALLGPQRTFETAVIAEGELKSGVLHGDLKLVGGGDANFGASNLPYVPPSQRPTPVLPEARAVTIADIEELADAVVAKGLREVEGDVVGDDTALSWEPIPPDWAADDLLWGYGAPVSALTVHDNLILVHVEPNPPIQQASQKATITLEPAVPYYQMKNQVFSIDFGHTCGDRLLFTREGGSKELSVAGDIAPSSKGCAESIAIEDPAEYGAMALKAALERRGVQVKGTYRAKHWRPGVLGEFLVNSAKEDNIFVSVLLRSPKPEWPSARPPLECEAQAVAGPPAPPQTKLASHVSAPLRDDLVFTNKTSQNLHAELMLRNLGKAYDCDPDARHSLHIERQFLLYAGLDPEDFIFYDGSGLSGHDLVTPRATVKLLQFATMQPWFVDWKKSLPVGGEDGSLVTRFGKAPLKDHVFAKTGTLGEARALSGYLEGASGKTVIFSIMVGNHRPQTNEDRDVMDKVVAAIAAAN
jgi:serine-type D-Ala-D-Ala carboxypeptidase/endopeptidase (penicillin-binding protein 4)